MTAEASVRERIAALVAAAPPLGERQRERIAAALNPPQPTERRQTA